MEVLVAPSWDECHREVQEEVARPCAGNCPGLGHWDTPLCPCSRFDAAFAKLRHTEGRASL